MNDARPANDEGASGAATAVWVVLVLSTLVRGVLAAEVPVLSAEAYYWLWSEQPAWGYLDHPPMVAAVMAAAGAVAGEGALGLRLGSVLMGTGALWMFHRLCLRLVDRRAALACLVFATIAPVYMPFGIASTPDAPLLFFWTAALLAFHHAWERGTWPLWLATGIATGLAYLSKYNGFQLPGIFFVFLMATAKGRALLKTPRPWVAVALSLALVAPNLLWNASHGGETLATPLKDGIEVGEAGINLLLFALLPFLVMTPVAGYLWLQRTVSGVRAGRLAGDDRFLFMVCATGLPLAAFTVVSVLTLVHAHWVCTALVTAIPLAFEGWSAPEGRRMPRAALATAAGVMLTIAVTPMVATMAADLDQARPVGPDGQRLRVARDVAESGRTFWTRTAVETRGDPELAERLVVEVAKRGKRRWFLASSNYHLVSKMEWMTHRDVRALPMRREFLAQYAHWTDGSDLIGMDALWVESENSPGVRRRIRERFESFERIGPIDLEIRDQLCRRYVLFWCKGYRGLPPPE